ncbi:MAG: lipid-A-disaccharide synthase [Candidatus Marinimicrobia bacterium]|nr:lipid-A-disaccharide synthase [Candidatus Neomarinimicrobiota bacterium]
MPKKIFISTGELSGDIHASNLLKELRNIIPDLEAYAIGGDNLSNTGAKLILHIKDVSVMGFIEVIKKYKNIKNMWKYATDTIKKLNPDIVILIDYPGFNLKLARFCKKAGIKVIYYIVPQVWAWGKNRVKTIKKYIDKVICILPFEQDWLKSFGIDATYVGHPIVTHLRPEKAKENKQNGKISIAILPGSRDQEIKKHLPVMLRAIKLLKNKYQNLKTTVALAPGIDARNLQKVHKDPGIKWVEDQTYKVINDSNIVLLSSGTATLETTLFHKPMVVCYKLSFLSYLIGRIIVNVKHIAIPNLIAGEKIVPELIQYKLTPENIYNEVDKYITNIAYRESVTRRLQEISKTLQKSNPSKAAAHIIAKYIHEN